MARSTLPSVTPAVRRRRRRWESRLLRWEARLDAASADRLMPWVMAGGLFVVLFVAALARADRLEPGVQLARHIQAAWHVAGLDAPRVTIGGEGNLLAERAPLLFLPLGALTRFLPATATLLGAQAASLALGVVPLWRLARNVAALRVGAAASLVAAYACSPALADLDLGDFHPAAMAMAPVLWAAYHLEREQWRRFGLFCALAVLWSSELGLLVAGFGLVLLVEGNVRVGTKALVAGVVWALVALVVIQAPLGPTGLVAPGAFADYGDSALDVLIEMVRNPFRPLGDLVAEENIRLLVWILAPLLFLPVLATRRLLAAVPLTALYLVADVPMRGAEGGARTLPLLALSFVAATFALNRLGRRSIERVLVDRRVLLALVAASAGFLLTESSLSPYLRPFGQGIAEEVVLRDVLTAIDGDAAVRAPARLLPLVAEREVAVELEPPAGDAVSAPRALSEDVDVVVTPTGLLDDVRLRHRERVLGFLGFERRAEVGGVIVYERVGPDP